MATTTRMTLEQLERLPEDERGELIRGEWRPMCPPGLEHGEIALTTGTVLRAWVKPRGLGVVFVESGFTLGREPDTVVGPDVAFLRAERLPPSDQYARFGPAAPDLAVEIVSPSDSAADVEEKVRLYLDAGTSLLWVVEPRRRTVTVYAPDRPPRVLAEGDTLDGGDVLPGFSCKVSDLFV